jgi:hypothetical protein
MGSGKSEIAINYALLQKNTSAKEVQLLDLDIIKPYIRIRDVSEKIKHLGIKLIMPDEKMRNADMPIIPNHMIEFLTDPTYDLIIDIGGEERGCITIAQFKEYFEKTDLTVNLVINPFRPFSATIVMIHEILESLQNQSKIKVTGLISNPHLRFNTSIEDVMKGTAIVEQASRELNVPLVYVCIWHKLITETFRKQFNAHTILPLRLYLSFPWENGLIAGL